MSLRIGSPNLHDMIDSFLGKAYGPSMYSRRNVVKVRTIYESVVRNPERCEVAKGQASGSTLRWGPHNCLSPEAIDLARSGPLLGGSVE